MCSFPSITREKLIGKLEWESELDSRSLTHCTFPQFQLQIDLEALMLLDEANLLEMKMEIGPRKKILKAIDERRKAMEEADEAGDSGPMKDSRL